MFSADVTPPLGHPLLGGLYEPALRIDDPLFANGFALLGADKPLVFVAVDWCEIRNESYQQWRTALAQVAGTVPARVLVTSLHQHNAPLADLGAQRFLENSKVERKFFDSDFHEQCIQRICRALADALKNPRQVSHFGIGQAKVKNVASNRRAEGADGKLLGFHRNSSTPDAKIREAPEGLIDPWLKTLSFWDGNNPVMALSSYAVHAQTHFGKGDVTSDFLGWARARRQKETSSITQIYAAGCSGDVVVGKYNDGDPRNWPVLTENLYQGIVAAWNATQRFPLSQIRFRSIPLALKHRDSPGFTVEEQKRTLADATQPYIKRALAAMGLSWRQRIDSGHQIDIPVIDFGKSQLILLPGETFVQYQLWAQDMRTDSFVMVLGYGECAPGYIPTVKAVAEGWEDTWMWADPQSSQATMMTALSAALKSG